jgi:hypothetical protein
VEGDEKTIIQACEVMYPDPWDDHKHLISTKSCTDEGTKIRKKKFDLHPDHIWWF